MLGGVPLEGHFFQEVIKSFQEYCNVFKRVGFTGRTVSLKCRRHICNIEKKKKKREMLVCVLKQTARRISRRDLRGVPLAAFHWSQWCILRFYPWCLPRRWPSSAPACNIWATCFYSSPGREKRCLRTQTYTQFLQIHFDRGSSCFSRSEDEDHVGTRICTPGTT